MKIVGKGVAKIDGLAITTGQPVYTNDLAPQNTLVVKVLRSPHAFAKIKSIDKAKAEKLSGVDCVLTFKEVPRVRFTGDGLANPEPSPYDRLILDELLRYVGDPVAIIAALDEKTACQAMELIKVDYEVYEPVLDFETAIEHPSIVHPEADFSTNMDFGIQREKNIVSSPFLEYGDVEEELKKCDVVAEGVYYTQAQAHAAMETHRAFSYLDHMGRLVVVSSTQVPFHVRRTLARALQLPASRIRVIKPRIGGGFGGKLAALIELYPAIVTMKTGKPAKIIYGRQETFSCTTSRHAMKLKVRVGADREGYIRAVDIQGLSDTGAYGEHGHTVFNFISEITLPLYNKTRALRFQGHVVYTNKMPGGALRGYGATQGTFAFESTVNKLAHMLQMDPVELRMKNLIKEGDTCLFYQGRPLGSSALQRCVEKGKEMIGWQEKYPARDVCNNKVRAVGMAVTMQSSGIAGIDTTSAEIRLNDDANFTLLIGSSDMGTGSDTILVQIAAEVLQVPMDRIIVNAADTDVSPYDMGSYASRTTYCTGMAVAKAAAALKEKIVKNGARFLKIAPDEAEFDGKEIRTMDGDKSITLEKLAETLVLHAGQLQLVGNATTGNETAPTPFVAGFAEVEVDRQTGKVDLVEFVGVVDCGTVINANLAKIQAEGGLVQGVGMAMFEDVRYDERGKLLTNSFMQYKIPCIKDINKIRVAFEESFEETGPFGAKSIGEILTNTPSPAIADAVYNAVGATVTSLPITPEKVFMGMPKKVNAE